MKRNNISNLCKRLGAGLLAFVMAAGSLPAMSIQAEISVAAEDSISDEVSTKYLDTLLEEAAAIDGNAYYEDTYVPVIEALATAEAVTEETTQEEVDAIAGALGIALAGLVEIPTADTNLALNKTVMSKVSSVTNGSTDGYWDGGDKPAGFVIDLGEVYAVEKMTAFPYVKGTRYYNYYIEVSEDGETYTKVAEKTDKTAEVEAGTDYEFEEAVNARYVKVTMTHNSDNNSVHMREFAVYAEDAQTGELVNVALNKTAAAFGSKYQKPVDGATSTYWDGGNIPSWFVVDLGYAYPVNKLVAFPYNSGSRYYNYYIEVSEDGLEYTKVAEKMDSTPETASGKTFELEEVVKARYVKVTVTHNSGNNSAHMREIQVYPYVETRPEDTPIVIEAENYDSYAGTLNVLKNSAASGGAYVGDFGDKDCLTYIVDVPVAGNYQVLVRVGTINDGGTVLVNCNGSFSQETDVPNTGGWQVYQDVETKIWMESGKQSVTVTNFGAVWNLDKLTLTYLDSEVEVNDLKPYDDIYLENRWKNQRMVERDGVLQYADESDADYDDSEAVWDLIPDGTGFYEIQNAKSGSYIVMTDETNVVSLSEQGGTDAGKWQIGALGGRLEFYNKQYVGACITLEYQSDYPDQVLASTDSLAKWYSSQWAIVTHPYSHEYEISGDRIDGTAGTAVSTDGKSITVNKNGTEKSWSLSEDISEAPVFTAEKMPIMEAVYNLTMEESYLNINKGRYGDVFWTGTEWQKVWTRDTAMSVQYSLAWVFPEETKNSIMEKIIGGTDSPFVWEEDTGTGGSYPSSIDRIIMMIASWELYQTTGDLEFLELAYDVSKNTLEQDYHVAYDEISGLFKGETGGLDHRSKTYPDWMDHREEDSIINIAESKPGNANIIFAQVLNLMAQAGEILGKDAEEIADWKQKYESLKAAINERLWLEDRGMYSSWEYPEYMGSPVADKVDVIANGYAIMFDIADEEHKQQIMENYPLVVYGANTVWPQKNGRQSSAIYHNRGVWPGWEATLMIGAKENGNNQLAEEILKSCVRGAGMSLTNKEVINYTTGAGIESDRQLWSIAATLAGYYRVLFGMDYSTEGISFAPYVPEWMEGPYSLTNYKYRDAVLNLTVEGTGDTLVSITVNGEEMPLDYMLPVDASGTYDIVMVMEDSGNRSKIHLDHDNWVVCPDLPTLVENEDGTLSWDENPLYTYKLWTGHEFVEVSGGSYTPDCSVYSVYSLVAVDKDGITSEMSKPIIISPEGSKSIYEAEDAQYDSACFKAETTGYTGSGYVNDFLSARTDVTFTIEVPKSGRYQISTIYNNKGDATTGQGGGIRSVYIDGKDVGTMAFPIVNFNYQRSSHIFVNLTKGIHTITFCYNVEDWYDTNMLTARGTQKNNVSYDSLSLQYIGEMVDVELQITKQPISVAAKNGMDAVVTVEAMGVGLTYTWYYKNPGNWKFYESGSQFVSDDGATYTIPMYAWRDGQEVYCVVTDKFGDTVQSNTVTLTMDNGSIQILKQPKDVAVDMAGDEAAVTVEATGEGLTYEWYYKNPGNVKFYVSGDQFISKDGATYTIPVAAWRDGQQVYCVITDANGISVQTNTVTLSIAK